MTDPMVGGGPDDGAPKSRSRDTRMVLTGVLAVLLVWFALANFQSVKIRFWVSSASAPLIVVIAISGALGALVSGLVGRANRRRRQADHPD